MDDTADEKATKKCDSPNNNKNNCDNVKNVAHCVKFYQRLYKTLPNKMKQ